MEGAGAREQNPTTLAPSFTKAAGLLRTTPRPQIRKNSRLR